ncbi:HPP family protein [Ammoniphilus sp. CFH 90114]|uniref:HPP family protein n=1 Tax=Ammoniphilus sp. CFH 90114 TaxID=2493665 RepID=UPI00100DC552|nr:HPP family protein [Ammoniphilus sp. CFH 90114]RXT07041.1 HPP family protein [Ammoniphilus sp. CFH 90114]
MYAQDEFNNEETELRRSFSGYIAKMKGSTRTKSSVKITDNIISATGGLIAIIIVSFIVIQLGFPMVLGPIAASCLLVFAVHEGPFSQPREVIGGHFISTSASLIIWDLFGKSHFMIGITLAVVVFLMVIARVVHPPAAASAIVAINTEVGWGFLPMIMISALIVVGFSLFYINLFKNKKYPVHW